MNDKAIISAENGWEKHWAENNTPWDAGGPAPALEQFLMQWLKNHDPAKSRGLVPGCGRGYDVLRLAQAGIESWGLDIAPSVRPYFEAERARTDETTSRLSHLVIGDFLGGALDQVPALFDVVWDYTFLCAIDLDQRPIWKRRMLQWLAPNGTLATLLYPVVPGAPLDVGPPFPLDPRAIERLLAPEFTLHELSAVSRSHPGREGKERLAIWRRAAS